MTVEDIIEANAREYVNNFPMEAFTESTLMEIIESAYTQGAVDVKNFYKN